MVDEKHSMGQTIAFFRKNEGLSQKDLADRLGVRESDVINWEKDVGAPDIGLLPKLAECLRVSIDYLLTGKINAGNTSRMPDQELCAKMDDLSMLYSIGLDRAVKDDSMWEYVLKYESVKVAAEMISKGGGYAHFGSGRLNDYVYLCVITNRLRSLEHLSSPNGRTVWEDGIKSMLAKADQETVKKNCNSHQTILQNDLIQKCVLEDKVFEAIASHPNVTDMTLDYLMAPIKGPVIRGSSYDKNVYNFHWVYGIPYIIDKCYELKQTERLEKFLKFAETSNDETKQAYKRAKDIIARDHNPYQLPPRLDMVYCGFVFVEAQCHGSTRILKRTFDTAMAREDWDMVKRFNAINQSFVGKLADGVYIANDSEIYKAKVNNNASLNSSQKSVALCLHDGILSVDELLMLNDYDAMIEGINKYPITRTEEAYNVMQQGDWKAMFRYAVDVGSSVMTDAAINNDLNTYMATANKLWSRYDYMRNMNVSPYSMQNPGECPLSKATLAETIQAVNECKREIISNIRLKAKYKATSESLSKEDFQKLLDDGNYEMLIIKLCVLLESVLKGKYGLDGDLLTMIDAYFDKYGKRTYDDINDRYLEDENRAKMHRFRRLRNSIVHPDPGDHFDSSSVTVNELKYYIDYICSLAKD